MNLTYVQKLIHLDNIKGTWPNPQPIIIFFLCDCQKMIRLKSEGDWEFQAVMANDNLTGPLCALSPFFCIQQALSSLELSDSCGDCHKTTTAIPPLDEICSELLGPYEELYPHPNLILFDTVSNTTRIWTLELIYKNVASCIITIYQVQSLT